VRGPHADFLSKDFTNATIDVREGEEIDTTRVSAFLKESIPGLEGEMTVRQFPAGASNLTYLLTFENRELVLRRPPHGTKAKSAHDMSREYRVLSGVRKAYPHVPEVLLYTDDESIIGSEFYVMERAVGNLVLRDFPPEWGFTAEDCRKFCFSFLDRLIELHQVDYRAIGLENLGKPEGYATRQILGWNKRYVNARTADAPDCEVIRNWLEERIPSESGACIIHGDFRIDNLIVDPDDPFNIVAVLDWEMATLGDPLMDLGNSLAYWIQADDAPGLLAIRRQPSNIPGMLTRDEIVTYYAERTDTDIGDFDFYLVYGVFRLAVILQQIYYRYYHGQTKDERFGRMIDEVWELEKRCLAIIG
jgi:aminoglycoside phosphotransferase (APT) family kinase protein